MMKFPTLLTMYLFSFAVLSQAPMSIDAYTKAGESAFFHELRDPGIVVLKYTDHVEIKAGCAGIDLEALSAWEEEQRKSGVPRQIRISYTNEEGVRVHDIRTGMAFSLIGVIQDHPIDRAERRQREECVTMAELAELKILTLRAWEAEMARAYEQLGGDKRSELKLAQEAWNRFREAQRTFLEDEYLTRQGTLWPVVSIDRQISVVRDRADQLKAVAEW